MVDYFVRRYAREMGLGEVSVSRETLEVLTNYPWPGNVRELQNVVKQSLALSQRSVITPEDLPEHVLVCAGEAGAYGQDGYLALREKHMFAFEKDYLKKLLATCLGDVADAAREARLPRGSLYRLLKRQGLDPAEYRKRETLQCFI